MEISDKADLKDGRKGKRKEGPYSNKNAVVNNVVKNQVKKDKKTIKEKRPLQNGPTFWKKSRGEYK